ncbi:MAG: hypothetical protein PHU34_10645 [Candidatus Methanoperedens sp.]|nr:hypothetical protein [Candidatus Methanoperedens sp.]
MEEDASDDDNGEGESGTKVRVRIPVEFEVDYIIEVNDPDNVDEIQERMLKFDASRWEQDPEFYGRLGQDWDDFVRKVTKEHIQML